MELKVKKEIATIAQKNRIVDNIIKEIAARDSFLVVGHKNPDEDCIASLVSFGLILSKFSKNVTVSTCGKVQEQLQYLLNICKYNSINMLQGCGREMNHYSCVVILDTPKPSMIDTNEEIQALLDDPKVRKIEIDHHLASDSAYAGDEEYCLVCNASSTCELIGFLGLKMMKHTEMLDQFGVDTLFSRNLALAVLTGIIGDSKMGKFLKTNRERWFYKTFSNMFGAMLKEMTVKGSRNFSTMEEVFKALESLSTEENECFDLIIRRKTVNSNIGYSLLSEKESLDLFAKYGNEIIVTVTKAVADKLSDASGRLGLIVYYDAPEISNFIQFRLRRNHRYTALDLRDILEKFKITNGGGHPGAIGFRIEKEKVSDLPAYLETLVAGIEEMMQA